MRLTIAAAAPEVFPADVERNKVNIIHSIQRARDAGAAVLVLPDDCIMGLAGDLEQLPLLRMAAEAAKAEILAAAGTLTVYPLSAGALRADELPAAERQDLLCCCSDRPATALSVMENEELCAMTSADKRCAVAMATPLGASTTDFVYDGRCVIAQNGFILASGEGFVSAEIDFDSRRMKKPVEGTVDRQPKNPWMPLPDFIGRVLPLQAAALARRMQSAHCQKAVVGVSGGLDSTLTLAVCVRAMELLGRSADQVVAVTMPCFGTTGRTRSNAQILAEALGCDFRVVDIKSSIEQHLRDIGHDGDTRNNAYENAQARERTQVLMDIANDENGLAVGTGDLSEAALGWCTYSGDHMCMYNVNAGVPKTVIRLVLRDYAATCGSRTLAAAIRDVLDTPVSPELLPPKDGGMTQLTEDIVGPYELHDFFLYYFLKYGFSPRPIHALAVDTFGKKYSPETIKGWLGVFFRRFFQSQFKRSCCPDGPAVLGLSLSPRAGFKMPSDAVGKLWLDEIERL